MDQPENPIVDLAHHQSIRAKVNRLLQRMGLTWMLVGTLGFLMIGVMPHHETTEATAATKHVAEPTNGDLSGTKTGGTKTGGSQGLQISLADRLRVGLKAKTKQDKDFILKVVKAVNQGKLPRRLVDSTFLWARERAKQRSKRRQLRPIVYFWPAMQIRAKKLGISLPQAPWNLAG